MQYGLLKNLYLFIGWVLVFVSSAVAQTNEPPTEETPVPTRFESMDALVSAGLRNIVSSACSQTSSTQQSVGQCRAAIEPATPNVNVGSANELSADSQARYLAAVFSLTRRLSDIDRQAQNIADNINGLKCIIWPEQCAGPSGPSLNEEIERRCATGLDPSACDDLARLRGCMNVNPRMCVDNDDSDFWNEVELRALEVLRVLCNQDRQAGRGDETANCRAYVERLIGGNPTGNTPRVGTLEQAARTSALTASIVQGSVAVAGSFLAPTVGAAAVSPVGATLTTISSVSGPVAVFTGAALLTMHLVNISDRQRSSNADVTENNIMRGYLTAIDTALRQHPPCSAENNEAQYSAAMSLASIVVQNYRENIRRPESINQITGNGSNIPGIRPVLQEFDNSFIRRGDYIRSDLGNLEVFIAPNGDRGIGLPEFGTITVTSDGSCSSETGLVVPCSVCMAISQNESPIFVGSIANSIVRPNANGQCPPQRRPAVGSDGKPICELIPAPSETRRGAWDSGRWGGGTSDNPSSATTGAPSTGGTVMLTGPRSVTGCSEGQTAVPTRSGYDCVPKGTPTTTPTNGPSTESRCMGHYANSWESGPVCVADCGEGQRENAEGWCIDEDDQQLQGAKLGNPNPTGSSCNGHYANSFEYGPICVADCEPPKVQDRNGWCVDP